MSTTTFIDAVLLQPPSNAPFSSVTLPMRLFLTVTLGAWFSNTAPVGVPPLASTSRPSKVTLLAWLWSWRTLLPASPRNVIVLVPPSGVS